MVRHFTSFLLPAALLGLAGCAAGGPASPGAAGGETAIVGVAVIPMTASGVVLHDQTVIVRGDRITHVGPASLARIPSGAVRIDGRGRYLIPGLADMHVHLEYFEEPEVLMLFLANGVTTIRNMDGRDYLLGWKRGVAEGSLPGPTIVTAGPLLDGDPPILPDNTVVSSAAEARDHVLSQSASGYDFIKVYSNLALDAYEAVLATAREVGMKVAGHLPRGIDIAGLLASGQRSVEHLADFDEAVESEDSPIRGRWHWSRLYLAMPTDTIRMADLAERLAAAGIWIVPTLVQAHHAVASGDTLREWLARPEMAHVPADGLEYWTERVGGAAARMDGEDWAVVARGRANRERLVSLLHSAGGRLVIGTDSPNPFVVPGFSVAEELENFVRAGFTPWEALAAATREASLLLDELNERGTIESGRRADLVLLDANPLTEISNVRRRAGVMARGRWLAEPELQSAIAGLVIR